MSIDKLIERANRVSRALITTDDPTVVDELLDALASARAERDEARTSWKQAVDLYEMEVARVDPALAEIARLKAALEPFYRADKALSHNHLQAHVADDDMMHIRAGDVRAASDAYHMPKTMIERVARAIDPAAWNDLAASIWATSIWRGAGVAEARRTAMAQASAVLEAMRSRPLHIVFTGFPGPGNECVFVEVETSDGKSVNAGEWRKRPDGLVELVIGVDA